MLQINNYKYIFGLGNPGAAYSKSPHNLGYIMIDAIIKQYTGFTIIKIQHQTLWKYNEILLSKPSTYMNRSGDAIAELFKYLRISKYDLEQFVRHLLIIHDDIELNQYDIRYKNGQIHSGLAGHNGLRSIVNTLMSLGLTREQSVSFDRIRIGCKQNNITSVSNYVTAPIKESELAQYLHAIDVFVSGNVLL